MNLTDLAPEAEDFGVELAFMRSLLGDYAEDFEPVADAPEMFLDAARRELTLRLPIIVGFPVTWPGYDISIARADDVPAWRYLISRAQLMCVFDWKNEGEGSVNHAKWKQYTKQFESALAGISATINGAGGVRYTTTGRIKL